MTKRNILDAVNIAMQYIGINIVFLNHGRDDGITGRSPDKRDPDQLGELAVTLFQQVMGVFFGVIFIDDGLDKALRGGGAGIGEDRQHIANLLDSGIVNHRYPVADLLDHVHIMGNQQNGQIKLLVDILQELQYGPGGLRIQSRGSLIGQQDFGVIGQSPGYAHPLLLAAAELIGINPGLVRQAYHLQKLINPFFGCFGRNAGYF